MEFSFHNIWTFVRNLTGESIIYFSKFGKIVILEFYNIKISTANAWKSILYNLPIMRTRCVFTFSTNESLDNVLMLDGAANTTDLLGFQTNINRQAYGTAFYLTD